ncbi:MAG: tRNA uridine-5-carboxymethylaminomethyl(34) synthesis GTPase MnmE [bacterium]|nr:tRNA uridine-5-carboxymethylaminomethyl(34) synthesis GTPase MnmE [bacterium]
MDNRYETIAAIATAPGLGGVAILRLSGPEAYVIADSITRLKTPPSQRTANTFVHTSLYAADGAVLDDALVLFFRAPRSYTGEDTVEFQTHGGAVVAQQVLERLYQLGARPAGPGEFTRRAFLNGRLDLTQAEAVADVIAARTPRAERAARANLQGRLGAALEPLYEDTLRLSVETEHLLDFDEGELPDDFFLAAQARLTMLTQRAEAMLATWHEGRLVREGALVVLAGLPNAGKSTVLNLLLGYNRAIVSDEAGTTRDSLEETFVLDGVPIRLTDTAGLREAPGAIEREGVARARELLARADAVLYLIAATTTDMPPEGAIVVQTKADLLPPGAERSSLSISVKEAPEVAREALCQALRETLQLSAGETTHAALANARQFTGLTEAVEALRCANEEFARGEMGYVTAAQQLRRAAQSLGQLLGRVWSDDLLDQVFSSFCVGK